MWKLKLIALILLISLPLIPRPTLAAELTKNVSAHTLRPFRTNGCSAPFKLANQKWTDCCSNHDFAYWICGDQAAKRRADADLVNCLRGTGISGSIAAKVFEWAPSRLSDSHWCARWSNSRKSGPLNAAEIRQVRQYEESFSLKFPITKMGTERDCTVDELPESLHGRKGLICFDLVKLNPNQINEDRLVYSDDCLGYFVVHNKKSVEGFGQCANLVGGHQNESAPNCYFSPSPVVTYSEILERLEQNSTRAPREY